MKVKEYSDLELRQTALWILYQQLGAANTVRFLSFYQPHTEDYLAIQDRLFEGLTTEEVYENAANFWQRRTSSEHDESTLSFRSPKR